MHALGESIEERDTYHQLDLLGRAAVGLRRCRVGRRFALAACVHGRVASESKEWKEYKAAIANLELAHCMRQSRVLRCRGFDVTSSLWHRGPPKTRSRGCERMHGRSPLLGAPSVDAGETASQNVWGRSLELNFTYTRFLYKVGCVNSH